MASDLDKKIIKQIEYYFGDFNLQKDNFLQEKVKADEGWVSLEVLLTFKRLASLTTDPEVIVKALEKSESGLVAVSEDGKKIRRSPEKPLPKLTDENRKELVARTAYAKGFPLDESLDNIMNFLDQYGPIEACTKRTYVDKVLKESKFKGSCFVVFKDVETCKKFIEADNVKYGDTIELIRKFQSDYLEGKREEFKVRRDERRKKKEEKEQVIKDEFKFPKGAVFFFSGVTSETLPREEIKEKVNEIAGSQPSFVDYYKGNSEGHVRMPKENDAVEFFKKLTDGKLEVGKDVLTIEVLEGEKEEEYFKKAKDMMSQKRKFFNKGNKKNNRKRFGGNNSNAPKSKKAKN